MPRPKMDPELELVLNRLINHTGAAEGSSIPPRQAGDQRIPWPSGFRVVKTASILGGTLVTLTFLEPDRRFPIAAYNIYASNTLELNKSPLFVGSVSSPPGLVIVTTDHTTTRTVVFHLQVVFTNGQVSKIEDGPTCAAEIAPPLVVGGDVPASTLTSLDVVTGRSNLATAGAVPFVLSAGVLTIDAANLFFNNTDNRLGIGTNSPQSPLHVHQATLGNEVQRLSSTATNDDPAEKVFQNRVATTDATVTTLHTFAIPATTTKAIEAVVIARRTGGTAGTAEDGARYKLSAVYKNVAGTATLIGAVTKNTDEDQAGWDSNLTISSGNVLLTVTGALDNNISWHVTAKTYEVST